MFAQFATVTILGEKTQKICDLSAYGKMIFSANVSLKKAIGANEIQRKMDTP